MHDDIHVRLQPDVARHCLADPFGTTRYDGAAVHLFEAHDTRVGVVHRRCGLDVMCVKGSREPEVNEFW
jgi:hypothetical protein